MTTYRVEPVEGEKADPDGHQWGWRIVPDQPGHGDTWEALTGGTGPCWNIRTHGDEGDYLHICELDDLIAALTALRDSEAHSANVRRWE